MREIVDVDGGFHARGEFESDEGRFDEEDVSLDDVADVEASVFGGDGRVCGLDAGFVGA